MAMAVAVKNSTETTSTGFRYQLVVGSFVGVVYVLCGLALILFGLPAFWWEVLGMDPTSFVDIALLMAAMVAAVVGLVFVGAKLAGPHPPHGLRAGIFVGLVGLLLLVLVVKWFGDTLEGWGLIEPVGIGATVGLAALLLFFLVRAFFRPGFEKWLGKLEDQGWFTTTSYKASQGLRVRRGTILGILAVAGCGIYTMWIRNPLLGDWELTLPYTDGLVLPLLPYKKYTLPLLLALAALWFAWRVVNYPTFADFLIATEAEMNKVSWTTRKRLVQDTIVVLVTVVLLTFFLFIVDILWIKILSWKPIEVLRIDTTTQQAPTSSEKPEY
jgi:preprotein translocase SecE subunit